MLPFENYVRFNRQAFTNKVRQISTYLRIRPEWLMVVMMSESGLNHQIVNSIGAVGLIQFLPATARGLGTTTQALRAMSNVRQLDYVYAYYRPYAGRMRSVYDLYLVAFYPAALGKPTSHVIGSERGLAWARTVRNQNYLFDKNRNGYITISEFFNFIKKKYGRYLVGSTATTSSSHANQNLNPIVLLALAYLIAEEIDF